MAKTGFTTSSNLKVQHWSAYFFQFARYKSYFAKFIGKNVPAEGVDLSTDPNNVCQVVMDLSKKKGDKITFPMMAPFRGTGKIEGQKMEDNEEEAIFYDWSVELKYVRNAARGKGKLSDKRVVFDTKMKCREGLGEWGGNRVDNDCLAGLSGLPNDNGNVARNAPSTNKIWNGGQTTADVLEKVTNIANIDSSSANLFGPRVIEAVKRKVVMTEPKIRPIKIKGKDYYVMLIHPYQAKALKSSAAWINKQLYADLRGEDNPLATGSLGAWDGVIIHEWEKIETRYGEGSTTASEWFDVNTDACYNGIYVARALFLGAQAVVQAWGEGPSYVAEQFDYEEEWGVCLRLMMAASKPEFNSEDYGVCVVNTAYVPD